MNGGEASETDRTQGGVLIVGAGPTGLTLALCLREFGVPFSIIERRAETAPDTKALGINILSQYLFGLIGRREAIGTTGVRVHRMNVYWQGRRLNAVDFRRLDFSIRAFVTQPQWVTELELARSLEASGARIRRSTELVGFEDDGAGVTATLRSNGRESEERHAFVVGCDGKASRVREQLGIALHGTDYPLHFVLGDFEFSSSRLVRDQVHYFVYEDTFFIFAPIDARTWRVVVKKDGPCPPDGGPSPLSITEPVEERFGVRMFEAGPSWISRAPFYMRVADSLGAGRALLAGDAAHLFSPIGGTGMNTGMQDAFNLAWKLAYTWHGYTRGDALLQSYNDERLEAIHRTAAVTDLSTRLIAREERSERFVAPYVPSPSNRRAVAHDLPMLHSGLAVAYTRSGIVRGELPPPSRLQPGQTLHALPAMRRELDARGRRTRLGGLVLVGLGDPQVDRAACDRFLEVAGEVQRIYGSLCAAVLVVPHAVPPALGDVALVVSDAAFGGPLGLPPRSACVVRPDGIIGWGGDLSRADDLLAYLGSILRPRDEQKAVA